MEETRGGSGGTLGTRQMGFWAAVRGEVKTQAVVRAAFNFPFSVSGASVSARIRRGEVAHREAFGGEAATGRLGGFLVHAPKARYFEGAYQP